MTQDGSILRFARRYMTPYLHWYVVGALCMVLTNWIAVTIPMYVAQGIDALNDGPAGIAVLKSSAMWVAGLGIAVIGIRTGSRLLFFTPGRLIEANVKRDLFARILAHQPAFLSTWPTGDLISRVSSDTNMLRMFAGFATMGVINTVTALVLTGGQMFLISPRLAGMTAIPLTVSFLVIQLFMRRLHTIMSEMQKISGELSDHALSSYQGVATIQAFDAQSAFSEAFEVHNAGYLRTTLQRANLRTVFGPVLTLGAAINTYILIRFGGPMAIRGDISLGELIAFIALVVQLTGPLRGMSFIVALVKQAQASLERIDAVVYAEPLRPDLPDPAPAPHQPPGFVLTDASLTYPGETEPSLAGVNLEIEPGTTVGIVGPTGSGKTTLLRMIARLYNPPEGTVQVAGNELLEVDLDGWRRSATLVPQRAFLFTESIRSNILLGRDDEALLERVLELASLDVDLAALPQGVDTQVGEAGVTLSGGQRQRTALARGLSRTHQVLLLDDVLSAVDHTTEQQLIASLRAQDPPPTTLIVAHRLAAIRHAAQIVVLREGKAVDIGTHAELIEREGFYRDTWLHQAGMTEDDDG